MSSKQPRPFLVNATRKKVLAKEGRVLRSPLSMALGAMFRGLPGSFVFVWPRSERIAVTNLFVFEDIDVAWLDGQGRVVHMTHSFRSWSLHTMNKSPACYVIELPSGTLVRTKTQVGDRVLCRNTVFART